MVSDSTVTFIDVHKAHLRLANQANRTPLMTSRQLDFKTGARVYLKCENFQRTGSFKFRGAFNALSQLDKAERNNGVLTWSSGNHAQAIALAGKLLGIPRTIVMPEDAPKVKIEATRAYGAEVVFYNREETDREELGRQLAEERGLTIIPPYDHRHIIAGQGTAAMELIEETGPLHFLFVCVGGGGLISGSAISSKALCPTAKVIGVEPATADDATRSWRTGVLQTVDNPDTIADGARTPSLGTYTFPLVRRYVDDMMTVTDEEIIAAMKFCWERLKLVVEPTGALALAGLFASQHAIQSQRVGVIISGGNVDVAEAGKLF